jgi:hypothetical protein
VSLADKLKEATRSAPGLPCGISKLMATVSKEDREALEIVFSTKSIRGTISNVQLHELLLEEGHDIAFASIRLHRGQRCRCYVGQEARMSGETKVKK